MRGQRRQQLHRLLQTWDRDELVPDRGLHLDLSGLGLGLELHLEFGLDGGRLWEELWRGLRRRRLARRRLWLRLLLDVDL